jgi:hypothetical protein
MYFEQHYWMELFGGQMGKNPGAHFWDKDKISQRHIYYSGIHIVHRARDLRLRQSLKNKPGTRCF